MAAALLDNARLLQHRQQQHQRKDAGPAPSSLRGPLPLPSPPTPLNGNAIGPAPSPLLRPLLPLPPRLNGSGATVSSSGQGGAGARGKGKAPETNASSTSLQAPALLPSARLPPTPSRLLRPPAMPTREHPGILGSTRKQAGHRPAAAARYDARTAAAAAAATPVDAVGKPAPPWANDQPEAAEAVAPFHTGSLETYDIIQKVGQGSYGEVFKAQRRHTSDLVALKRIRLGHEGEGFPITTVREVQLLRQLRHPNVVCLEGGPSASTRTAWAFLD